MPQTIQLEQKLPENVIRLPRYMHCLLICTCMFSVCIFPSRANYSMKIMKRNNLKNRRSASCVRGRKAFSRLALRASRVRSCIALVLLIRLFCRLETELSSSNIWVECYNTKFIVRQWSKIH